LGPRPGEVRQGGLKVLQFWRHSQKIRTLQPINLFSSAEQKTCHVFWAFEQLCTAFGTRITLAQIHVRSCCFGAKILEQHQAPNCYVAQAGLRRENNLAQKVSSRIWCHILRYHESCTTVEISNSATMLWIV